MNLMGFCGAGVGSKDGEELIYTLSAQDIPSTGFFASSATGTSVSQPLSALTARCWASPKIQVTPFNHMGDSLVCLPLTGFRGGGLLKS